MDKPRRTSAASRRTSPYPPRYPIFYPLLLDLRGKSVVVVGGGRVAERKVRTLLASQACVRLVSPVVTAALKKAIQKGKVLWRPRAFRRGDLRGALLVFAATDDPEINRRIGALARQGRRLVNVAKPPESSNFIVPAAFRRGDLIISVSTSGRSPALAKWVRQEMEKTFGREFSHVVRFLGRLRQGLFRRVSAESERRRIWNQVMGSKIPEMIRSGKIAQARSAFQKIAGLALSRPTGRYTSRSHSGTARRSVSQKSL